MKQSLRQPALFALAHLPLATFIASTLPFTAVASEQFETLTVTTNRMPSENLLAPTTVITRADIERLQISDLPSLLSRQPGIDMTSRGGIGKDSSLFIRGTSSRHVLVLVDGVKWQSATLGETNIQDFPVEQIERIEIVRGPRSGIYGSEAIGGVIQIFTRKGQQGVNPYAKITYGTHQSKQATVGVNGGNEKTIYSLSFNHQSTDGISTQKLNTNPDDDGYRNNNISAKIEHQLNEKIKLGANFLRAEAFNQYDTTVSFSFPNAQTDRVSSDVVQQVLGFNSSVQVNQSWLLSAQVSESRDQSNNYQNGISTDVIDTRHRFITITNTIDLNPEHILNIGLDYEHDHIVSTQGYLKNSRYNKAVFVTWQANLDRSSWLISGRHDDNQAFGTENTGTAEWGYWLSDNTQVTTNYGTGFKAPTFNDLYWPSGPFGIGNPDLVPEESTSWGIGLNGNKSGVEWGISFYKTKIDNLIEWAPLPGCCVWTPSNVSKAEIEGVDVELATNILGADIGFDASWLRPEDKETGNTLTRRAKRYANLHLDKNLGSWSAGVSWKLSGHRFNDASNTTRLGGFGIVDVRASYQLDQDWSVQASINNLFDKNYQTVSNFNSLGTTGMLTLSYKPK